MNDLQKLGVGSLQAHIPVTQAVSGGLLSALVVFAASSLGFSRPQNTFFQSSGRPRLDSGE